MAPLHFCTSGSEMPLTEEPGLYKRLCPRSPSHSVSTTNTLSGALCLRPLPSASRTSSRDCYRPHHPRPSHLLAVLPLPSLPAAVAGRCVTRQPRAVGPGRYFRLTLHKTDPPQDRWQDGDLERTPPPPPRAGHYRQYRRKLADAGPTKKPHAPSTKNNIRGLKTRLKK